MAQPIFLQAVTGMNLGTLAKVLVRNRGRVHWRHLPRLAYLAVLAGLNSYIARLEEAADGKDIAAASVEPPILSWDIGAAAPPISTIC
jgi:hypothetical protein